MSDNNNHKLAVDRGILLVPAVLSPVSRHLTIIVTWSESMRNVYLSREACFLLGSCLVRFGGIRPAQPLGLSSIMHAPASGMPITNTVKLAPKGQRDKRSILPPSLVGISVCMVLTACGEFEDRNLCDLWAVAGESGNLDPLFRPIQ